MQPTPTRRPPIVSLQSKKAREKDANETGARALHGTASDRHQGDGSSARPRSGEGMQDSTPFLAANLLPAPTITTVGQQMQVAPCQYVTCYGTAHFVQSTAPSTPTPRNAPSGAQRNIAQPPAPPSPLSENDLRLRLSTPRPAPATASIRASRNDTQPPPPSSGDNTAPTESKASKRHNRRIRASAQLKTSAHGHAKASLDLHAELSRTKDYASTLQAFIAENLPGTAPPAPPPHAAASSAQPAPRTAPPAPPAPAPPPPPEAPQPAHPPVDRAEHTACGGPAHNQYQAQLPPPPYTPLLPTPTDAWPTYYCPYPQPPFYAPPRDYHHGPPGPPPGYGHGSAYPYAPFPADGWRGRSLPRRRSPARHGGRSPPRGRRSASPRRTPDNAPSRRERSTTRAPGGTGPRPPRDQPAPLAPGAQLAAGGPSDNSTTLAATAPRSRHAGQPSGARCSPFANPPLLAAPPSQHGDAHPRQVLVKPGPGSWSAPTAAIIRPPASAGITQARAQLARLTQQAGFPLLDKWGASDTPSASQEAALAPATPPKGDPPVSTQTPSSTTKQLLGSDLSSDSGGDDPSSRRVPRKLDLADPPDANQRAATRTRPSDRLALKRHRPTQTTSANQAQPTSSPPAPSGTHRPRRRHAPCTGSEGPHDSDTPSDPPTPPTPPPPPAAAGARTPSPLRKTDSPPPAASAHGQPGPPRAPLVWPVQFPAQ